MCLPWASHSTHCVGPIIIFHISRMEEIDMREVRAFAPSHTVHFSPEARSLGPLCHVHSQIPERPFPVSQAGCSVSRSVHLVSESFQPTERICPSHLWVCHFTPTRPPQGMWHSVDQSHHQPSWESLESKDHLFLSEVPSLPLVETLAWVLLPLCALLSECYCLSPWPSALAVSAAHALRCVLPVPGAGSPSTACGSDDADFILTENSSLTYS